MNQVPENVQQSNMTFLNAVNAEARHDKTIFSRFPQPVELDLSAHRGCTPVELTGGVRFPSIGELSYLLTLPGHGFYWFQLTTPGDEGEAR